MVLNESLESIWLVRNLFRFLNMYPFGNHFHRGFNLNTGQKGFQVALFFLLRVYIPTFLKFGEVGEFMTHQYTQIIVKIK